MTSTLMYNDYCTERNTKKLLRSLTVNPSDFIDFSSNDFLKFSKNPLLIEAAYSFAKKYGIGATGSRLLSGNKLCHEILEKKIAKAKKMETSLIFSSGYIANSTTLAALLDPKILKKEPIVFFDKYNHNSLYQAVFLAKPQLVRYQHLDMEDLEKKLLLYKKDSRPKFIVSETLFSMDGDIVDLEALIYCAKKFETFLYLDEAYATGILGYDGFGLTSDFDLSGIDCVIMGTFSKAIGAMGAYVACSSSIKQYLLNTCPGFIYSTAISPMILGAVDAAWTLLPTCSALRQKLLLTAKRLQTSCLELGLDIGNTKSHIIPILLQSEETTLEWKEKLFEHKILVSAIRPPTVPYNTSRIRISLTSEHTEKDIEYLLQVLKNL